MRINIKDIKELPDFKRKEKAQGAQRQSDEFLMESIRNVGLNEPFTVKREGNDIYLIKGYRRLQVIKDLNRINELHPSIDINALPAIEIGQNVSPIIARLASDIRQDLKPSERAHYINILLKNHGMTQKAIAMMFGWSVPSVANWLVILDCIDPVKKAIDFGKFPMSAGKIFSVMENDGQEKLFNQFKDFPRHITREELKSQATKIPDKYYKRSYNERMKMTKFLTNASGKGHVHTDRTVLKVRELDKQLLNDQISLQENELDLLKRDRDSYSRMLRTYVYEIETWFRNHKITEYIKSNHLNVNKNLTAIIELDRNTI